MREEALPDPCGPVPIDDPDAEGTRAPSARLAATTSPAKGAVSLTPSARVASVSPEVTA